MMGRLLRLSILVLLGVIPAAAAARRELLRSQYAYAFGGAINCSALQRELVATSTTSYSFLLEDTDGRSYLSAVACLQELSGLRIDDTPFTAWFTLIPPAEGALGSCSHPADSPLTQMNETSLFNFSLGSGCYDYLAWAEVIGLLSAQFPAVRYLNVDDFSDGDNEKYFSPESSRRMVALLRPNARLVPTLYYTTRCAPLSLPRLQAAHRLGCFVAVSLAICFSPAAPDRASLVQRNLTVDGALFYFRNEKEGVGPCAASAGCPINCSGQWPGSAGCLSGSCAEPTVANLAGAKHLPLLEQVCVTIAVAPVSNERVPLFSSWQGRWRMCGQRCRKESRCTQGCKTPPARALRRTCQLSIGLASATLTISTSR